MHRLFPHSTLSDMMQCCLVHWLKNKTCMLSNVLVLNGQHWAKDMWQCKQAQCVTAGSTTRQIKDYISFLRSAFFQNASNLSASVRFSCFGISLCLVPSQCLAGTHWEGLSLMIITMLRGVAALVAHVIFSRPCTRVFFFFHTPGEAALGKCQDSHCQLRTFTV